jgi:uncharacterized protein (DUF1810 family)
MTDPDLVRFVVAQDSVRRQVVEELTAGRKQTHWMWFVFPQLAGLGHSAMAERYAIRGLDEAKRYLVNSVLGDRLRHDVRLVLRHNGKSAYLSADRRHRRRSTSFPRRAKRPCNGHLAVLIEARSPDRTIGEARTRSLPLLSRRPPRYLRI